MKNIKKPKESRITIHQKVEKVVEATVKLADEVAINVS